MTESNQKKPSPIDAHVGSRIRLQRAMIKMSQTELANRLGITFQQIQKYEKGTNRIGASRLLHIANSLGVTVAFFFENAPDSDACKLDDQVKQTQATNLVIDFLSTSEGVKLNCAFVQIKDANIRKRVVSLVNALASDKQKTDDTGDVA